MRLAPILALVVLAAVGCKKSSSEGLPPATDWQSSPGGAAMGVPSERLPSNPHAGVPGAPPIADDPHAGVPGAPPLGGTDPHAGVPGAPPLGGGDPHGAPGIAAGPDVTQLGLASPDPNRPIDPNRRIRGVLKAHPKASKRMLAGGAVFLIVKRAGPDGQPTGAPLAVDKVGWKDGLAFELSEKHAMIAGTELTGEVILTARYDQDSDAISKQPGDVTGLMRVKVPADGVEVMLDNVLP